LNDVASVAATAAAAAAAAAATDVASARESVSQNLSN